jgi:ABC-type transport system involved in multi-copper enzyme maturation permease subunit
VSTVVVLVGWALREAVRRRIFVVVSLLTVGFLALFWVGTNQAFVHIHRVQVQNGFRGPDQHTLAGAVLFGLALFAVLFLGSVLAVFLTIGTVRGDAESGVLQALVVRPVGRAEVVLSRWLAAVAVCSAYVAAVYAAVLGILRLTGDYSPDRLVGPGFRVACAVAVMAGLCVLGSVFLSTTANGIAAFMLLGAGLFAGLLGQVGHALSNTTLQDIAHNVSWALPFEALYQDGLALTTADQTGLTGFLLQLGPFGGGARASSLLWPWVVGYAVVLGALSVLATNRRDL